MVYSEDARFRRTPFTGERRRGGQQTIHGGGRYRRRRGSEPQGLHTGSLQEDRRAEEVRDFNVADVVRQDGVPGHLHKGRRGARQGRGGQGRALRWRRLGEAIAANEVRGCAAVATDPYSIERSVLSNNCQVLCLGERVVAPMLAERVVQRWPGYGLDESSLSARKADLISECE
jgi:ribose 5-phosphate isomerase B